MNLYKHIFTAAALVAAAGFVTSCSDDNKEITNVIPDKFQVELTSINIPWDEVEAVIDFEAPESWVATSNANWITVESVKGEAGIERLYVTLAENTMLLSRSGEVTIECGQQNGIITITQGGCSDPSAIKPIEISLEIPSFDYETDEVPFSFYSDYIKGNLGLTMEQFGQGVDEDGDLQFFMVAKDGSWYQGGTSGTRLGAWLDADYNVVPWDGAGYPAIATFIEIYGGEDPMLVIGRAPGVPDNAKYVLNFGIATADLKLYQLFSVTVTFPAADLKGTTVGTIDLSFQKEGTDDYASMPCKFDVSEVTSLLGCSSIQTVKVVGYDAAGEFVPYTANNGYWYDTHGAICSWGEGAGWFIEYYGNDAEAEEEDLNSWWIGNFPGVENASGTSNIGFWYNGNVVMFNIHVTIGEGGGDEPDTPTPDDPEDGKVSVVASNDMTVNLDGAKGYDATFIEFDANEVIALLGCFSMDDVDVISLDEEGNVVEQTANNGYWYNVNGEVCHWGDEGFAWYIEYWGEDEETPGNVFSFGNNPDVTSASGTCNIGFAYNGKAVMYEVTLTVE